MLFLLFYIGEDGYALAADGIVEILPLVDLRRMRHAPPGIAGSFDYRGQFVPVVDLCTIELDRPAQSLLSTRIILVRFPTDGERSGLLGLIAESATETLRCDLADFTPFATSARGLVQRVETDGLLTPVVREFLLLEMAESS